MFSTGPQSKKNIIFPYSILYIQLDTNTGKDGESSVKLFKRSMIKMPKMDVMPIFTSEYPFFTKNIRYPKSLEREDWRTKYEFFFNRQVFLDKLNDQIDMDEANYIKPMKSKEDKTKETEYYEKVQEIEKENVMITLRCLLPIPEVFGKTLMNSYDHILKSGNNERIFKDINLLSTLNIFGFMYKFGIVNKEKQEYFINVDGKRYMVDSVIWENDVVNHPVYKKFLLAQRNVYEEVENNKFNIEQRKEAAETDFLTILSNPSSQNMDEVNNGDEIKKIEEEIKQAKIKYELIDDKVNSAIFGYLKLFEDKTKQEKTYSSIDIRSVADFLTLSPGSVFISDDSRKKLGGVITSKLKDVVKYIFYLRNTNTEKPDNRIDTGIKNINKIVSKISDDETKEEEREKKYLPAFKASYELIKYFEDIDIKSDTKKKISKYYKSIKKNAEETTIAELRKKRDEMKDKQSKAKKNKKQRLAEKTLLDSFKSRTSNAIPTSGSGPSFQLQQFQNAMKTIDKLLTELFDNKNDKLTPLKKAEKLISIQEEIEQYGAQSNTRQPEKSFFESSEIPYLQQLIKTAIQVKAANIVNEFAENNTPMNLSDKALDGKTDISNAMKSVNEYITKNYATEVRINNKLSNNTSVIYEPVRKTSNRELYEVVRLFKVGEKVLKAKNKSLTDAQIDEYKKVINDIYDEYILGIKSDTPKILDRYFYVGTDDVNINQQQDDKLPNDPNQNPSSTTAPENANTDVKRNVKEIYVQVDLVDADTFEKTERAPCKLYDKEMAEEFMYLADPRNKNNRSLSRFRNLDFNSVVPDPLANQGNPGNPIERKGGYTRRTRSANGSTSKTLRSPNTNY